MREIPGSGRSLGVGNGTPLQYSRLENSMGSGTWQASPWAAKSQTSLCVVRTILSNASHSTTGVSLWSGMWCLICKVSAPQPYVFAKEQLHFFFFFWAITFQGKGIISKFLPFPPWSGSRVFLWNVSINQNGIKQTHSQTHPANGWTKQTEVKAQLLTDAFQLWQKACGEAWWATPAAGACAAAVTVHRQTLNAALTLCSVS